MSRAGYALALVVLGLFIYLAGAGSDRSHGAQLEQTQGHLREPPSPIHGTQGRSQRPQLDPPVSAAQEGEHEPPLPITLTPEEENVRIISVFDKAGASHGDEIDQLGYECAKDLVALLATKAIRVSLPAFRCSSAGCLLTLKFEDETDYNGLSVFLINNKAIGKWPGSKVYPPALVDESNHSVTANIILVRGDVSPDIKF
jgi:hypothetical protein